MSYQDDEASVSNAKPVELYKFEGTYANYYYTSGVKAVDYGGHTYNPIALKRSAIVVGTQDDDNTDITVQLKATNQIVLDYGFETSPPKLDLTIYRYHDLSDVKQLWFGPVTNIQVDDGLATIRSPSLLSSILTANAPNVYYQSPCNNVLFDARCKVNEATFTHDATITAVAGKAITVDGLGTLDGKLVGGELRLASGERRMIVSQVADVITVNFPFSQLLAGAPCSIVAGCDHLWAGDCKLKFNNRRNFGGFVFIPPDNPFTSGIDPSVTPIADNTCLPPTFSGWWLKLKVSFWQGGGGPTAFPSFGVLYDTDGDGAVNAGSGIDNSFPTPTYFTEDGGAHAVQELNITFNQELFPTDFTRIARRYRLTLQFASGSVIAPFPAMGVVSYRKWDESGYTSFDPIILFNLFPVDYEYIF